MANPDNDGPAGLAMLNPTGPIRSWIVDAEDSQTMAQPAIAKLAKSWFRPAPRRPGTAQAGCSSADFTAG
jgi:hypothetical protein